MAMYEAKTRGVRVSVTPQFMEAESSPQDGRYFWAYSVEIVNEADETVQLISRHWRITDGDGQVHEVKGPGVVGEQPVLHAGESYSYTSGCPLSTAHGSMVGAYQMVTAKGERFEAAIPAFPLQSPYARVTLH
jgi:ApaG protein